MTNDLFVRAATADDWPAIWALMQPILAEGETYVWETDDPEEARRLWLDAGGAVSVATRGDTVVGTSLLKPNQPGRGSHVCNAAFMVAADARGSGAGRRLLEHALEEARRQGFRAMQFNMVVSTNARAIALWQRYGFEVVGRLPRAFRHQRLGWVDALIMYRTLDD